MGINYQKIYEYEYEKSPSYKLNNWGFIHLGIWLSYFEFSSVIEIGCGNGDLLNMLGSLSLPKLERVGIDVVAVDQWQSQNYDFLQLDVSKNELPYSDKHFDLGISFDMFEHLLEPDFAIKELLRVSKSQIIAVPHSKSFSVAGHDFHLTVKPAEWWLDKLCNLSGDKEWRMIHIIHCNHKWLETFNPRCNRTLYLRGTKE